MGSESDKASIVPERLFEIRDQAAGCSRPFQLAGVAPRSLVPGGRNRPETVALQVVEGVGG